MPKFRKKPVVIEAIQYIAPVEPGTGNVRELLDFCGGHDVLQPTAFWSMDGHAQQLDLIIKTLEDGSASGAQVDHIVSPGDYIICGVKHEFYPCKPDIFEATYDAVE